MKRAFRQPLAKPSEKPYQRRLPATYPAGSERGRSSGVEHDLAKVGVEGSNPFARSNFSQEPQGFSLAQSEIENPRKSSCHTWVTARLSMATIRKRGGRYQVQVRRKGQRPVSKSFLLRADALAWGRNAEAQADRGELAATHSGLKTVGDLLRRYETQIASKKRAYSSERYMISLMLRDPLAAEPIATIRTGAIAEWRDRRLARVGAGTFLRHLTVLRHVFEVARKEWGVFLSVNPTIDVRKPKAPLARNRRLKPEEEVALFGACRGCLNPLIEPIVRLALYTGMRRGELLSARWQHFEPAHRTLLIPMTKNGHPRTVPLDAAALAVIDGLPRSEDSRLLPLSDEAVKLAWKRLIKRAGIVDFHFHDLRHEAITRFFERGLTVPEVALISGHRDVRMLFRYTHLKAEDVAARLASTENRPHF